MSKHHHLVYEASGPSYQRCSRSTKVSVIHTISAIFYLATISKSSIFLTKDLVLGRKINGRATLVSVFKF